MRLLGLATAFLCVFFSLSPDAHAQISGPGDIMFVGYNADGSDGLAFVLLQDTPDGTTIQFTDTEWSGTEFVVGEGNVAWTNASGSVIAAGTVVVVQNLSSGTLSANVGTPVSGSGTLDLNASNEVIYAYIGGERSPTAFLSALANDDFGANGQLTGTGLTVGATAIEFTADEDVLVYSGSIACASASACASQIADVANWSSDDGTGDQSQDGTPPDFPDDVPTAFTISAGQVVTLTLSAGSGTISEVGETSVSVTATIETSDGAPVETNASADIILADGINDGDFSTTYNGVSQPLPLSVPIPAGTASGATVTTTATAIDDAVAEGDETFVLALSNPQGVSFGTPNTFDLTITDDDFTIATDVWINEVRGDDVTNDEEYVELAGAPGTVLQGLTYLVIGDGGGGSGVIEAEIDLTGQRIPASGYFVVAEGSFGLGVADLTLSLNFEDSDNTTHLLVAEFTGANGDDLDTDDDGVLDVMPWTSVLSAVSLVEDPDLSSAGSEHYYAEQIALGGGGMGEVAGPDGSDPPGHVYRNESTGTYQIGAFDVTAPGAEDTPGAANPPAVEQADVYDGEGFRLVTLPIVSGTVADLAEITLIQGVTGQYGDADPVLFTDYTGAGYASPSSSADALANGKGFYLYLFDRDFDPRNDILGGGTSRSVDLSGFTVSLAGTAPTSDVSVPFAAANRDGDDGFYMVGNPFADPLDLFGVTLQAGNGALSRVFQTWDPAALGGAGDYVALDGSADGGTFLARYQGVFATVSYAGLTAGDETAPTFAMASAEVDAGETPPFYGRRAGGYALALDLAGETERGAVGDGLADLWFRDGGSVGRDPLDAGEILPPHATYARLAVMEGDRRLAIRALPLAVGAEIEVPVAFLSTAAGSFTVTLGEETKLPDGWTSSLVDSVTGDAYDLAHGLSHTFDAEATGWTERFVLTVSANATPAEPEAAPVLAIGDVYPNPSADAARLRITVDVPQQVSVTVFDALGREVARVLDAELGVRAETVVDIASARLAPGVYVVRVEGETFSAARRLVVAR